MSRMPLLVLFAGGLLASVSGRSNTASAPSPTSKIILHAISSASNRGVIDPAAAPVLDEAAWMLQHEGAANVIVAPCAECSTDDRSAAMLTSSVRKYLQEHGTAASRIESVGFAKR